MPSVVSARTIPHVNKKGRSRIIQSGTDEETANTMVIANSAISLAVSKPSPNKSGHNCRMTEGDSRTHGKRAFSILQKLTGRVVNGHNVVSIHSMTQSQRVCEDSQSCQPSKRCAYNE